MYLGSMKYGRTLWEVWRRAHLIVYEVCSIGRGSIEVSGTGWSYLRREGLSSETVSLESRWILHVLTYYVYWYMLQDGQPYLVLVLLKRLVDLTSTP